MTERKKTVDAVTDERENHQAILPAMGNVKIQESRLANLTIKVHKHQRLHWLIEAKKQGTSLTAAITDALNKRFGMPE